MAVFDLCPGDWRQLQGSHRGGAGPRSLGATQRAAQGAAAQVKGGDEDVGDPPETK